ncbi:MAG: hypothetical protein PHF37_01675 [Phycisphaerae bacterium]|nr:hypothetical protein [Phycisphaerae bacterium]
MVKKQQIAGSIYQRNDRWYWRVKLPNQQKFSVFPLKAYVGNPLIKTGT